MKAAASSPTFPVSRRLTRVWWGHVTPVCHLEAAKVARSHPVLRAFSASQRDRRRQRRPPPQVLGCYAMFRAQNR
jgi:hypothetical protein